MKSWFLIGISLLCGAAGTASADGDAGFGARLASLDMLTGRFEQVLFDARGAAVDRSQGWFAIAKPKVRWEVEAPFPQTIVLDADRLQVYDPDLAQVTVRDIADTWSEVPIAMLARNSQDWSAAFDVLHSTGDTEDVYVLRPRAEDALFESLTVVFVGPRIQRIEVLDHVQQRTLISLDDLERREMLESGVFELDLPPDTEIVRG